MIKELKAFKDESFKPQAMVEKWAVDDEEEEAIEEL